MAPLHIGDFILEPPCALLDWVRQDAGGSFVVVIEGAEGDFICATEVSDGLDEDNHNEGDEDADGCVGDD